MQADPTCHSCFSRALAIVTCVVTAPMWMQGCCGCEHWPSLVTSAFAVCFHQHCVWLLPLCVVLGARQSCSSAHHDGGVWHHRRGSPCPVPGFWLAGTRRRCCHRCLQVRVTLFLPMQQAQTVATMLVQVQGLQSRLQISHTATSSCHLLCPAHSCLALSSGW